MYAARTFTRQSLKRHQRPEYVKTELNCQIVWLGHSAFAFKIYSTHNASDNDDANDDDDTEKSLVDSFEYLCWSAYTGCTENQFGKPQWSKYIGKSCSTQHAHNRNDDVDHFDRAIPKHTSFAPAFAFRSIHVVMMPDAEANSIRRSCSVSKFCVGPSNALSNIVFDQS